MVLLHNFFISDCKLCARKNPLVINALIVTNALTAARRGIPCLSEAGALIDLFIMDIFIILVYSHLISPLFW
jgi:hypothetical protein